MGERLSTHGFNQPRQPFQISLALEPWQLRNNPLEPRPGGKTIALGQLHITARRVIGIPGKGHTVGQFAPLVRIQSEQRARRLAFDMVFRFDLIGGDHGALILTVVPTDLRVRHVVVGVPLKQCQGVWIRQGRDTEVTICLG